MERQAKPNRNLTLLGTAHSLNHSLFVITPPLLSLIVLDRSIDQIKVEFLLEDLKLPVEIVTQVETFAVEIKKLKCYSVTALIGDKLLTLAENTIGIKEPADIPKQIYDVSLLSEQHMPTERQLSEIIDVIEQLTLIEAGYRNLKLTPKDALRDVGKTMEKYSLLDTAGADDDIKRNINPMLD